MCSFSRSPISQCIKTVLRRACVEKRLTVGLLPAIQYLSTNSNRALFCVTAEAPPGDSATHMQEVLLQAFCVENDIYVIKVNIITIPTYCTLFKQVLNRSIKVVQLCINIICTFSSFDFCSFDLRKQL